MLAANGRNMMFMLPTLTRRNNLCHTFLAEGVKKLSEPDQEPTESIAVHLKTKDEVRQMLQDHQIIEGIMAAPALALLLRK